MPISTFMGLETTLRALLAGQRSLDVTGHNIANANTAGYSRQEAALTAADALEIPSGAVSTGAGAQIGTGVEVEAYRRIRDQFLDVQYRAQTLRLGDQAARSQALDQVELALAEPGENGIAAQLDEYWSAWQDVANNPESQATRQSLVDAGTSLAGSISRLDGQMATVSDQVSAEFAAIVGPQGDVGLIAGEISRLNDAVRSAVSAGEQPNDLLDRRDALLDRLADLGRMAVDDLGDGQIRVSFGDAAAPLVDGTTVTWPQTLTSPGGKLGALLDLAAPTGVIASYRADLGTFAAKLADSVNALHGSAFFSYTPGAAASTLSVAVTAGGVNASLSGSPGANDVAIAISRLRGGAADSAYSALVSRIGNDVRDAKRQEANAQVLVDAVEDRRQSTAGVSVDEEVSNMVRFQRGYQAAARAMSTMDEMLDTLINRTGRVGL